MNLLPVFGEKQFPDWLRVVDIRPVQWACVCAADHPTLGDELTEEQYKTLPHLIGWPNSHSVPLEEYIRRQLGVEINVRATVQSLVEISYLLQGTELIATLPGAARDGDESDRAGEDFPAADAGDRNARSAGVAQEKRARSGPRVDEGYLGRGGTRTLGLRATWTPV